MDSKYGASKQSAIENNFKFSNDRCDHLISTSLRDLSKQYQDLSREIANSQDIDKGNISEIVQVTNSNKK